MEVAVGRPKVTVIVATSNRDKPLAHLLDSLSQQTFRNFEVVVVSDNESEKLRRRVRRIVSGFRGRLNIRLVENPRRLGIPRSLNRGLRVARGSIVAFTDDDCIADRHWLERLLRWYKHPAVGGVGGRVVPIENDAKWIPKREGPVLIGRVTPDGCVYSNFDLGKGPLFVDCLPGANMSFRRRLLMRVGGFSPIYGGNAYRFETDLSLRIRRLGYRIVFDPSAIIYHKREVNGGARLSVPEWNYWFSRNHTLFLLKCVDQGLVKVPLFLARQVVRVVMRKRACPYGEPRKWHIVLAAVLKGVLDGLCEGLRYAAARRLASGVYR